MTNYVVTFLDSGLTVWECKTKAASPYEAVMNAFGLRKSTDAPTFTCIYVYVEKAT